MEYPAIVYKRERIDSRFAGNVPYSLSTAYQVQVIDRDPDSPTPGKVARLPKCRHRSNFVVDGLHHDNFTLYF